MSSHDFGYDYVESSWANLPHRPYGFESAAHPPPTTSQVTIVNDPRLQSEPDPSLHQEPSSPLSQPTVVPYAPTPPPAPTPPSIPSESEIYGPDRLFGHPPLVNENVGRSLIPSPGVRFDQPQFPLMAASRDPAFARDFKDELARAAGVVTPGVDDGPYIRYALDAMTRRRADDRGLSGAYPSSDSDESYYHQTHHFTPTTVPSPYRHSSVHLPPAPVVDVNVPRAWSMAPSPGPITSPPGPPTLNELRAERQRHLEETREMMRRLAEDPLPDVEASDATPAIPVQSARNRYNTLIPHPRARPIETRPERAPVKWEPARWRPMPEAQQPLPRTLDHWQPRPDIVTDPETGLHNVQKALKFAAPLTFKPWALRSQSLLFLATLCVLMIAALMISAVFSTAHNGLTLYAGTIYGGQYFLFRMLPQLLAIIILIYAQCVITAAFWVLPFSAVAADDHRERRDAVFLPLYLKSFLWPQLVGSWNIWIPILNVWLLNFTIPLQSSLFTVILVDGNWTWATVQGVAWTLVALYVSFFLSLVVMFIYWHRRRTGMIQKWDVRNLGDIIFLLSQSNSLSQYDGLETAPTRRTMEQRLGGNTDRLGFWFAPEAPDLGTWHGVGMSTSDKNLAAEKLRAQEWNNRPNRSQREGLPEAEEQPQNPGVRYRYLPWCFRDGQIIIFAVASSILLIALIVVSFLRSTDLRNGFLPLLNPAPVAGAFSAADFLYSFLPSLIGLVLFLMFQSLDLTLRILTPWGELARAEGSRAETSLLLDYAVCLPLESTYKALRNKHWRVAFVSLLSPLFALLPVLGGGIFLALTPSSGSVRMYPNVPAFAIIIALLFLYVAGLVCLVPNRKQFRLPHAVTCLAEIISFCCNDQLLADKAFDWTLMLRPIDLATKLDVGKDWHRQGRWTFSTGRNNDERLGIKRLSKYTVNPKKLRDYDRRARGQLISLPLPNDSSSLFKRQAKP